MIKLAPLNAAIPADVKESVVEARRRAQGRQVPSVRGPGHRPGRQGRASPAGKTMTDDELGKMDYYVEGVGEQAAEEVARDPPPARWPRRGHRAISGARGRPAGTARDLPIARGVAWKPTSSTGSTCSSAGCTSSAGVAWIGASFYFVMLDNSLSPPKRPEDARRGVFGELWAVHGGGFYNSQKYLTGPKGEPLPENLHWSKWEAYTTWLSGMGLLALIYWYGASSYLIDQQRAGAVARRRDRHQHRVPRRRLARLRPAVPAPRRPRKPARRRDAAAGDGGHVGAVPRLRRARRLRPRRRDDRHDDGGQRLLPHHPGAEADGRRHPRRPGARPDARGSSASSARCTTRTSRCPCCS